MEKTEFIQRRFFQSRQYRLERDGVAVTEKGFLNSRSYHVPYECVSPKPEHITSSNRKLMSASMIFTALTLIVGLVVLTTGESDAWSTILFWGVVSIVCWVAFVFSRVSVMIYAQDRGMLLLYADQPSPDAVARFVRQLFEARNVFLRSKYGKLSLDQPLSQRVARLEMLRDQEAISEQEFNRLRKLQSDDRIEPLGPIGFSN